MFGRDLIDPLPREEDVRARPHDGVDHPRDHPCLLLEEGGELGRVGDADLRGELGLLHLEGTLDERDAGVLDELRHRRMERALFEEVALDQLRVPHLAAGPADHLEVPAVEPELAPTVLDDLDHRATRELREVVPVGRDPLRHHRGPGDREEHLRVLPSDRPPDRRELLEGARGREPVALDDQRRMDPLLEKLLGPVEELPGEDDRGLRAVPALEVLGARDLGEHLRRGVLDLHLPDDRGAVVRDDDVAGGVDEHLVHPAGTERRPDRLGHRAGRVKDVPNGVLSLPPLRSLPEQDDRLTGEHDITARGIFPGTIAVGSRALDGPPGSPRDPVPGRPPSRRTSHRGSVRDGRARREQVTDRVDPWHRRGPTPPGEPLRPHRPVSSEYPVPVHVRSTAILLSMVNRA